MVTIDGENPEILRELSRDRCLSHTELAGRGAFPSACLHRVQDPPVMGQRVLTDVTVGLLDHTNQAQEGLDYSVAQYGHWVSQRRSGMTTETL